MKERFPSLIALFLLLLLVLGTWWAADYTQHAVPTDPPRRLTHEMDAWSRDFVMVRSGDDGKPINRLEGDYGEHYPDDDSYEVTNPRAVGLRPNTPITVATSDTAIMYEGGKRIVMNKNAHMHRQADAQTPPLDVRSEQLVLLPDDDLIETNLPAVVTRGQSVITGTGMQYNNKTRQLEVYSSANVNIAPADTQRASSKNKPAADSSASNNDAQKPGDQPSTIPDHAQPADKPSTTQDNAQPADTSFTTRDNSQPTDKSPAIEKDAKSTDGSSVPRTDAEPPAPSSTAPQSASPGASVHK